MNLRSLFAALLLLASLAHAQTSTPAQDQQQRAKNVKDAVQGGWSYSGEAEREQLLDTDAAPAATPQDQLDNVRALRNEAMVRTQGELTPADRSTLEQLAGAMNSAYPQSFEAHLAGFYAEFPAPSSFMHVDLAAARDPNREEIIAPQLVNSARKDRPEEMVRWSNAMKERGEVAPGLYRMAEDVLLSVEKNGVLIAAGEMDAYPLWVEQYADDKRKDVLVIDHRLLGDPAYRTRMWERCGASKGLVPADAASFIDALPGAVARPVFLSLALGAPVASKYQVDLHITGMAMRFGAPSASDMTKLESHWRQMHKATDAGPLSRNYLLPGAVLLKYFREIGDEQKAAAMEAELRALAAQLGATKLMYESGVFQH